MDGWMDGSFRSTVRDISESAIFVAFFGLNTFENNNFKLQSNANDCNPYKRLYMQFCILV